MMNRISKLRKKMKQRKIDAAIFLSSEPIDDSNIYYFTGFQQERGWAFACYIVTQKKTYLILSSLDYERARGNEADEILEKDRALSEILKDKIGKGCNVGVIESLFPHKLSKLFKVSDISEEIQAIRSIKEPEEIRLIRKACSISNKGLDFLKNNINEGISEKDLALKLENFLIRRGADGLSFPTCLVSSSRSWQIHPFPSFSEGKIKRGLGYVDFGARYKGYCSDVTLPFGSGNLTSREKMIVKTVEEAYQGALKKLKEEVKASKLYEIAERIISGNGFEFKHSLGHGLGLETHDPPAISPGSITRIKRNMIFTIEPGVYVKGVGGCRLENDFLMKKNGFETLTKSSFFKI